MSGVKKGPDERLRAFVRPFLRLSTLFTPKKESFMFSQRLFNLVSRLIFSRWARNFTEHHGSCEDAYAAVQCPLGKRFEFRAMGVPQVCKFDFVHG